jgi:excisionase family DNA binding protein
LRTGAENAGPFDLESAAKYLEISKSHLYQLTSKGLIAHYKPAGKKIYFDKADLDEYLHRNRVRPQWEAEAAAANA